MLNRKKVLVSCPFVLNGSGQGMGGARTNVSKGAKWRVCTVGKKEKNNIKNVKETKPTKTNETQHFLNFQP